MRLSAEAEGGDSLDNDSREWTVPDFTGVDPSISTPLLYRARTARDIQTLKAASTLVPDTNRTFSRVERLLVRFEVYGPGTHACESQRRQDIRVASDRAPRRRS